jgi:hypothetical protein
LKAEWILGPKTGMEMRCEKWIVRGRIMRTVDLPSIIPAFIVAYDFFSPRKRHGSGDGGDE